MEVGFALPEETPAELPPAVARELREALPPWPGGDDTDVEASGAARRRLEELGPARSADDGGDGAPTVVMGPQQW